MLHEWEPTQEQLDEPWGREREEMEMVKVGEEGRRRESNRSPSVSKLQQ
jgi:hypothetical protein